MFRHLSLTVVAFALAVGTASADEFGTAEEAKALTLRAIEHIGKLGAETAFKDISNPNGPFVDRDLYVFCLNSAGFMESHGRNAGLIGKDNSKLKDADGKEFVVEMLKTAASAGEGWIDYKWPNPVTKKIEAKSSFVKKYERGLCGVGIYKK